ncbi:MAG: hypothetical protein JSS09_07085 [Verrucomicrobia bacterium]|nr:hypothetical protein [Verrucomicrobiota bacterium]
MKITTYLSGLFLCLGSIGGYADWNQDFDEKTNQLIEQIPKLQEKIYLDSYERFIEARGLLLRDPVIKKKMSRTPLGDKLTLLDFSDQVVMKKRRNDHIYELFAWELSCLLGLSTYMVPSFPIEIEKKKAMVQSKEKFTYGKGKLSVPPLRDVNTVSLESYWKAHFCAYLLGIADLVGKNIGIGNSGNILFFDAEVSFSYQNEPFRTKNGFSTGFIAQSFEWDQYNTPLDETTSQSLKNFVKGLSNIEDTLRLYEEFRSFPILSDGFTYRLQKIREFVFQEGASFKEFFRFIYPKLGSGLDKLSHQVSEILQKKVGHGNALIFMTRQVHRYPLSSSQKKSLDKWLNTYID